MKRAAVTGATSMIGAALIRECVKQNIEVLAIVRKNSVRRKRLPDCALVRIIECELDELDTITGQGEPCDVFYHLAWEATAKGQRDDPILQERNIKTTLDAVNLAKRLGCRKFVGAGSQAEYGRNRHVIAPDTPVFPCTAYGMAKYAAGRLSEALCQKYGIIHIWGRIFSVYGRYDNAGTMLDYAIGQLMQKEPAYFSPATQMWDYLHETDAGRIFYLLGEKAENSAVYCVASGEARPLKEYIFQLAENFGPEAECIFASETDPGEIFGLQADTQALRRDLGFVPEIPFQEGIADMIAYQRQKQKEAQDRG